MRKIIYAVCLMLCMGVTFSVVTSASASTPNLNLKTESILQTDSSATEKESDTKSGSLMNDADWAQAFDKTNPKGEVYPVILYWTAETSMLHILSTPKTGVNVSIKGSFGNTVYSTPVLTGPIKTPIVAGWPKDSYTIIVSDRVDGTVYFKGILNK